MSHTTEVLLIADQEIEINGEFVNIHNIKTIVLDSCGKVESFYRHSDVSITETEPTLADKVCPTAKKKEEYKKAIEFLDGKTFRFIKKADGYLFTTPGEKPHVHGKTIIETINNAIKSWKEFGEMQDYYTNEEHPSHIGES